MWKDKERGERETHTHIEREREREGGDCCAWGQNRCKKGHTILFLLYHKKYQKTACFIIMPRENFVEKKNILQWKCTDRHVLSTKGWKTHTYTKCVFFSFSIILLPRVLQM